MMFHKEKLRLLIVLSIIWTLTCIKQGGGGGGGSKVKILTKFIMFK
jgi:hypothetical protein